MGSSSILTNRSRRTFRPWLEMLEPRLTLSADPFVLDPNEVGWASYRNFTSDGFAAHFNEMSNAGYMVIDIEVNEINGQERVAAVWQQNTDGRGWAEWRNLTDAGFHAKWQELSNAGYRVIDQDSYTLGGTQYYAGVWIQNVEGYQWASRRNLTDAEFAADFQFYSTNNYLMIDVEAYPMGGSMRYAAVWVQNVDGRAWAEWRDLTSEQFSNYFNQYQANYRMLDVESYQINGAQRYAGIWVQNTNNRDWAELRDMTEAAYRNNWYRYRDLGYRLIDFEMYESGGQYRYAGIWRQNGNRRDWALRGQMDAQAQAFLPANYPAGLGVAIAQGGEIKYMRGFGYQDIANNIWYSSESINRLASVSKAVAGVLTLNLHEDGVLPNLDATTRSFVPTMPAHHTHTLRQLLAVRGGVRHYEGGNAPYLPVPENQFNTALSASQNFWGQPLVVAPGTYHYSTHGYTLLGAAIEAATGKSIDQTILDELTIPYGLSTLRSEQRNVPNEHRAKAYTNGVENNDNLSWKRLGGGLESSTYDLVRFGIKVLDNTILSAAARHEMWTVPPAFNVNYALGWDVGNELCARYVAKAGGQPGANTYILMYPEQNIVITVLMNQDDGPDASVLAHTLGRQMLTSLGFANPPPACQISVNNVTVDEGDGTATFVVSLNAALAHDVKFGYMTRDVTAQQPGDYTKTVGEATILAGATTANVSVPIQDDAVPEPVETFELRLTYGSGAVVTGGGVGIGTINDDDIPINLPPDAVDDIATTVENNLVTIDVLANDSDPDSPLLSIDSVSQGFNGTVTHDGYTAIYTPNTDFSGQDWFAYTVSDGQGGYDTATVSVTVNAVNDPPITQNDVATTDENTPVTIAVLSNDFDPDSPVLSIDSVSNGFMGTAVISGDVVIYTPVGGLFGVDMITYTATDGAGGYATASVSVTVTSVSVTVNAVNDPPSSQDDAQVTYEEMPVYVSVLANDTDPDGDVLVVADVTNGMHGSVTYDDYGVSYVPDPEFTGTDTFTYIVAVGNGGNDTATVTVTVNPVEFVTLAQEAIPGSLTHEPLSAHVITQLVNSGVEYWAAARRGDAHDVTRHLDIRIVDLPNSRLAATSTDVLFVDVNAAGHGWFQDLTVPNRADVSVRTPGIAGHVDLLTVITHEIGHLLGNGHSEHNHDLMSEYLIPGVRRLPERDDVNPYGRIGLLHHVFNMKIQADWRTLTKPFGADRVGLQKANLAPAMLESPFFSVKQLDHHAIDFVLATYEKNRRLRDRGDTLDRATWEEDDMELILSE